MLHSSVVFIMLGFLVFPSLAQRQEPLRDQPMIEAEFVELKRQDSPEWILFDAGVKIKVSNASPRKLFILGDYVTIHGVQLFALDKTGNRRVLLKEDRRSSPSGLVKWTSIGESLYKMGANSPLFSVVEPSQYLYFNANYKFGFPLEGSSYTGKTTWPDVEKENAIFIEFSISFWEPDLRSVKFSRADFASQLSKRLSIDGTLVFETQVSKAIEFKAR